MHQLKLKRKPTESKKQEELPASNPLPNLYSPVRCPQSQCEQSLLPTNLLQHFLCDHPTLSITAIEGRETMLFRFEESVLPLDEPYCLGVLAYGGPDAKLRPAERPGAKGQAVLNQHLPRSFQHLRDYLPVLVMGCRTTCLAERGEIGERQQQDDVTMVLWLLTMGTTVNFIGYLSMSDVLVRHRRQNMVFLRELKESCSVLPGIDDPRKEWNWLQLNRSEIDLMSHGGTQLLRLEVMLCGEC